MERYALASSRLYVKLRRSSDTMAYNQAPVVKGNEEYAARVELLRTWLDSYRGPTPTLDLPPDQLPTDPLTTAAPHTARRTAGLAARFAGFGRAAGAGLLGRRHLQHELGRRSLSPRSLSGRIAGNPASGCRYRTRDQAPRLPEVPPQERR